MNQVADGHEPETELSGAAATTSVAPSGLQTVFFSPDGLRPGWGLLLFAVIYAVLSAVLGSLAASFSRRPENPALLGPGFVLRGDGIALGAVLLATWMMSRIEGRALTAYGLGRERWRGRTGAGAVLGLALLSVLVLALRVSGYLVFESRLLTTPSAFGSAAEWALLFLLVAFFEETLFRGYLQVTLSRGLAGIYKLARVSAAREWGFWTSAVLLSFGFGVVHTQNIGESPIGILAAGIVGVVFCLSLWRTGSLWWAIGFHAAWDWAQSFLFGVYDSGTLAQGRLFQTHPQGRLLLSGGLTGPEGSVLVLPTLLVMALAILITLPPEQGLALRQDRPRAAV